MKELTIEELKQMAGQPVWCPEEEAYGIVMCDKIGQDAQSRSGHPDSDGSHYGFKNDRRAERTEAASAAADQSNGGTFRSYNAAGSAEPARGRQPKRQRDRERRR